MDKAWGTHIFAAVRSVETVKHGRPGSFLGGIIGDIITINVSAKVVSYIP